MKHKSKLQMLHGADDETIEQIAAQTPADWETDETFEKSYRKYLAQTGAPVSSPPEEEITAEIRPARSRWMGILMTAACMALACGTVGTMFFLQRSAPAQQSILETETQTVTAAVSETEPETEPAAAPEMSTEVKSTDPVVTVPAAAETDAVVQTTAPKQEETQPQTENAAAPPPTQPVKPAETSPAPSEPAATVPAPMETEPPQESDPGGDNATAPQDERPGDAVPAPQTTTEHVLPFELPADTVFRITWKNYNGQESVAFNGAGPHVDLSDDLPELSLEGYTIEEPMKGDISANHYNITEESTGYVFNLHRFRWSGFYCEMGEPENITAFTINGREAYHNGSYIIWNDGGGISLLICAGPDRFGQSMQIAENLVFH